MKVLEIIVNWFYSNDGEDFSRIKIGDIWTFVGGEKEVKEIIYHTPQGEGDKQYADVVFNDGTISREFNLNSVVFKEDTRTK